jgi:hypothetical protein
MPAVPVHVFARSADSSALSMSSSLGPVYVAGFVVVGLTIMGLFIWFGIRIFRNRSKAKRDDVRGAAFLSVRGLVKEGDEQKTTEKELPENFQAIQGNTFSRSQITHSIVLPDKVLTRSPSVMRNEVIDFHRQSGTFPRPFAPGPFSFALGAGSSSRRSSILNPNSPDRSSFFRNSFASSTGSPNRFSVISTSSSVSSTPTVGSPRKVRQMFNPILPDELLITHVGERLTVVQSFDDGWCIVGRENSVFASTAKSLFKSSPVATKDNNVELGVVPAWCFLKPVKGLKAERPVRSTSLGITVHMEGPGFSSREEVMSWSNF